MPTRPTLFLATLAVCAATLCIPRPSEAITIQLEINEPKNCPKGLTIKAKAVEGGMVDFDVLLDPDQVAHAGDRYKGRVGATAYLELAAGDQKIGSVSPRNEKSGDLTRYRFRLSQAAVKASDLHLSLTLFEEDGTATVGGGVILQIHLIGFEPPVAK